MADAAAGAVTVVAILKNEAPYLLEWLAFHRAVGVSDFLLYDHGSDDGSRDLLRCLAAAGLLRWVDWDGRSEAPQTDAYNEALTANRIATRWVAYLDLDEFLVPKQVSSLPELLSALPDDAAAILPNWVVFGSNGQRRRSRRLVVDRFRLRLPLADWDSRLTKVVARREQVAFVDIHGLLLRGGRALDGSGGTLRRLPNRVMTESHAGALLQVNHYLVKSRQEFAVKLRRGPAYNPKDPTVPAFRRTWADFERIDRKATEPDRAIDRFRSALGRELALLRGHCGWLRHLRRRTDPGDPEPLPPDSPFARLSPAPGGREAWARSVVAGQDVSAATEAAAPYALV